MCCCMIKIAEIKQLPVIMHNYNLLVAVLFKKKGENDDKICGSLEN